MEMCKVTVSYWDEYFIDSTTLEANRSYYSVIIDKKLFCSFIKMFVNILGNYNLSCLIIVFCSVGKVQKINGKTVKLFQML